MAGDGGRGQRVQGGVGGNGDGIKTGEGSVVRKFRVRGSEREGTGGQEIGEGKSSTSSPISLTPLPWGREEREGPKGPVEGTSPFRMEPSGEGA